MKTKLLVVDNGEDSSRSSDHSTDYVLVPRSMPIDVALEMLHAKWAGNFIVLVAFKYDWYTSGQKQETLAEFFGALGPANATAYEKLSKPAKRYLTRAWQEAADASAIVTEKAAQTNGNATAASAPVSAMPAAVPVPASLPAAETSPETKKGETTAIIDDF